MGGGGMDLCKVPGVKFIWNKNFLSVFFFFSISNFSHCFLLFSGVFVNGHLYVNMKNQDQVLIDGLLENHVGLAFVWERRTWEILPWLSFNLLISRLSTSLCMVSGRCCISLKTKSWREDSYCVKEKNTKEATTIYWSYFLRMDILAEETQTWSTHWGCGLGSSDVSLHLLAY